MSQKPGLFEHPARVSIPPYTTPFRCALLRVAESRYSEAESLYERALAIREKTLGPEHPELATSLENYAALLRETARAEEAEMLEARAKAIRAKSE